MRAPSRFSEVVVAAAALLLTAAGPSTDPELRTVVGTVEIGTGEPPTWHAARSGELLRPGDVLRTGTDARAELETSAGTVRLYEHSTLRIPVGPDASSSIVLDRGASIFDIHHRDAGRPFEVRTPHAVVMVKGTRFSVSDDDGGASVTVSRGLVAVHDSAAGGREILVHPGFGVSGGAGRVFTLDMMRQNDDAWESWMHGGRPERLAPSLRESHAPSGIESAHAAAQAAASRHVAELTSDHVGLAAERERSGGDRVVAPGAAAVVQPPASARDRDDLLDHEGGKEVKEGYGEALLGGSSSFDIQVLKSGDFDRVHIVGVSGIDVSLSEGDLKNVISGNTALLGPQLLGVLSSRGLAPSTFAKQMLELL